MVVDFRCGGERGQKAVGLVGWNGCEYRWIDVDENFVEQDRERFLGVLIYPFGSGQDLGNGNLRKEWLHGEC